MLAALLALQSDLTTLYNTVGPSGYYEPGLVNILRSPGIDSQTGGPVRHPYLTYRLGRLHGWRKRFLGIDSWDP
jgi:hypothetical protein